MFLELREWRKNDENMRSFSRLNVLVHLNMFNNKRLHAADPIDLSWEGLGKETDSSTIQTTN
jgi:hypothetical protein